MSDDRQSSTAQWHERTVERSLRAARERAISRGDRFIAAATDLLRSTGKPDFTVQEVVDRSGMSLRSFYHHFATKDDLLLALVEETVRRYVEDVRPRVQAEPDPAEKLRIFLRAIFGGPESDDPAARGMVLFHWQLADTRAADFAATIAPQSELITEIVEAGVADGTFRDDIPVPILTTLITGTLLSVLDLRVLGVALTEKPVTADDVVGWVLSAIRTPGSA